MPRMLASSSVASSGMSRVAVRSSAELKEPRRRLPEIPSSLSIAPLSFLEFRRHAPVGLAERDALAHRETIGFLGRVDRGVESDRSAVELQRADGGRQDRERLEAQVDGAEQWELQQ